MYFLYVKCCVLFLGFFINWTSSEIVYSSIQDDLHDIFTAAASSEFAQFSVVQPSFIHSRNKREISSTKLNQDSNEHISHLSVKYSINNTVYILDLILNRDLLSNSYFVKHQKNGAHVIRNRTNTKDLELCHYKGVLRDVPHSWAAISTCDNIIRGVIFDGVEMNYIEPVKNRTIKNVSQSILSHAIYKHSHFVAQNQFKCGFDESQFNSSHTSAHSPHTHPTRRKRDTRVQGRHPIEGPYNANEKSRYLELVLVVDKSEYDFLKKDIHLVNTHCKDIANIINALYEPLNIFVALVGVVVWTEANEIVLSENGDITLTNFLHYRKEKLVREHPNDNAQLLTNISFQGGVVGKALKGPICTYEFSGGVNTDHSNVVGLVATTVAHEMGHNLGMEHDTDKCTCPSDRCIMAPSSSYTSPTQWSSCSLEYLALSFERGMDYCMRNKPTRLFDGPVCGNGFVEEGEQCDCGLEEYCKNKCCDASSCTFRVNATCATGACCNLETCQPKTAGVECRSSNKECDLPEYCTGSSEFCPDDVFKMDGEHCKGGQAYCFRGSCRTHTDQCRLLWGPSGNSSEDQCYKLNNKGTRHGNCGYDKANLTYSKCANEDVHCGMLHCKHYNERLEFGMESVAILSHSFINQAGSIIPCRSVIVDLGLSDVDPGLSPDGSACGKEKMCVSQKCVSIAAYRQSLPVNECADNCNGKGVCNSKGHCHCFDGFAPPLCEYPGIGGSVDSGPASDPNESRLLITLFYAFFVAILPLTALILFLKYYNNHPKSFWWKNPGVGVGRVPRFGDKKSSSNTKSLPTSNSNNSSGRGQLLLSTDKGQNFIIGSKNYKPADNMSGHTPSRPAPLKPVPPKLPSEVNLTPIRPAPKIPSTSARITENFNIGITSSDRTDFGIPPDLPPANKNSFSRPLISSPVLNDTSSKTVRELIDMKNNEAKASKFDTIPLNTASSVPRYCNIDVTSATSNASPLPNFSSNGAQYSTSYTSGPVSPPAISTAPPVATMMTSSLQGDSSVKSSTLPNVHVVDLKNQPKANGSTLNRIASFMSKNGLRKSNKNLSASPMSNSNSRQIEISQPILQTDINIPLSKMKDSSSELERNVTRTQSMRETDANFKRPNVPNFGSMRHKRPTSIPSGQRPTSPPPPTPSGIQSLPGYQKPIVKSTPAASGAPVDGGKPKTYDDCLNLLSESMAALAHVDTNPNDNIYAVIEESPVHERASKPAGSSSNESMGLLGEIVSEIQARNTESIYSNNLLSKFDDSDSIYMNTGRLSHPSPDPTIKSTTSSGYLSPINAINTPSSSDKASHVTEAKSALNVTSTSSSSNDRNSFKNNSSSPFKTSTSETPTFIAPKLSNTTTSSSINSKPTPTSSNSSNPSKFPSVALNKPISSQNETPKANNKPVSSSINTVSKFKTNFNHSQPKSNSSSEVHSKNNDNLSKASPSTNSSTTTGGKAFPSALNSSSNVSSKLSESKPIPLSKPNLTGKDSFKNELSSVLNSTRNASSLHASLKNSASNPEKNTDSTGSNNKLGSSNFSKSSTGNSGKVSTKSSAKESSQTCINPSLSVNKSSTMSEDSISKKPSGTTSSSYKPFSSQRGPLSGTTISNYSKNSTDKAMKNNVKPNLPLTSSVTNVLSKPAVPQRPIVNLKRPDIISSCSNNLGGENVSPDLVNKGNVASLQNKFQK